jgi:hypothetical protein
VFPIKRSPDADAAVDDCAGRWTAAVVSSGYIDNGRIQRSGHADPARNDECPVRHRRESVVFVTRAIPATLALPSTNRLPLIPVPPWTTSDFAACAFYVSGCVQPSVKIDVPEV